MSFRARRALHVISMICAFGAPLAACLPGPDDGTSSGGSSGSSGSKSDGGDGSITTRAGQACIDMAQAYAQVGARCGDTYEGAGTKFVNELANGDCNTVSIRNETELRNQCIPSFASLSCTAYREGRFAPSCAEQIIRSK